MRNVETAARDEHLRAAKIGRFSERGGLFLVDFRFHFDAFSVFRLQNRFPPKNRNNARIRKTGNNYSRSGENKKQRRFDNLALENPQRREWDADERAGTRQQASATCLQKTSSETDFLAQNLDRLTDRDFRAEFQIGKQNRFLRRIQDSSKDLRQILKQDRSPCSA